MMARLSRASDSVLRVLSSPRIAAAVMLSWILLLLIWIVPFVFYGIPGPRIQAIIYEEPFFLTVYVALLVSTVACILPRSVRVIRRARRLVSSEAAPRFPDDSRIIHTDPG
ncbi:MAG: cytochrome c biogenesis protein ResB, partial [Actinomycetota bacterium]|nr:cytochrome c biogenesis protein ResB [Actinomycetota bacterium]